MKMRVIFPVNTALEIAIIKPEKNSGLYEIWTHDFCDIPTELTNPLGALSVCNKPVLLMDDGNMIELIPDVH